MVRRVLSLGTAVASLGGLLLVASTTLAENEQATEVTQESPRFTHAAGEAPDMSMRGGGNCDSAEICDGDANGDGVVDPLDTGAILARFGLDPCEAGNCQFDMNCDGTIDPLDSGYVLARFGLCNPPIDCSIPGCGDPVDGGIVTCSDNKDIAAGNSIACSGDDGVTTTDNEWARCFDASNFPTDTTVRKLDFGVEAARQDADALVVTGTLFSTTSSCGSILLDSSLTELASAQMTLVGDGSEDLTVQSMLFSGGVFIPAGTTVVAQISKDDDGNAFFPGSNADGQTCISYISSDSCALSDLNDYANIGFPDVHLVLNTDSTPCESDDDCDDGDLCTSESCNEGTGECIYDAVECEEGFICIDGDCVLDTGLGDCCVANGTPGCNNVCGEPNDTVAACVCAVDDFCCETTWDSACVEIVELFSCADCSDNNPDCAECSSNDDCPGLGNECVDSSCNCVESPPVNDDCSDAIATTIGSGDSSSFDGNTTCATNTCTALAPTAEQWYEVTTTATGTLTVGLCGTPSVFGNAFITLDDSCPCSGNFTAATDFNQSDCGDGNWTLIWSALPADTYFYPVLSEIDSEGDFTVTFSLD